MAASLWGVVALGLAWAGAASAMPVSVKSLPLQYEDGFSLDTRLKGGLFAHHPNDTDFLYNRRVASSPTPIHEIAHTGKHKNVTAERVAFGDNVVGSIANKIWSDRSSGEDHVAFAHVRDVVGLVTRPTDIDFLFPGLAVTSRKYDGDSYVTRWQLTHVVDTDFQRNGKPTLLAELFGSDDIDIQGQPSSLVGPHDVELIANYLPLQQRGADANYASYDQSARQYSDVFSGRRDTSISGAVGSILLMLGSMALCGWCGAAILLGSGRRRRAGIAFGLLALALSVAGLLLFAEALGGVA